MGEAWTVTALGEPAAVLEREEVGEPAVGPGQVAVRVRAASVNFADLLLCQGAYHHKPPCPSAWARRPLARWWPPGRAQASHQGPGSWWPR